MKRERQIVEDQGDDVNDLETYAGMPPCPFGFLLLREINYRLTARPHSVYHSGQLVIKVIATTALSALIRGWPEEDTGRRFRRSIRWSLLHCEGRRLPSNDCRTGQMQEPERGCAVD